MSTRRSVVRRKPKLTTHTTPATATAGPTEYLSRLQAAALLGVDIQTIDAQINRDKNPLPAYHFGRRVLIKRVDLLAHIERKRK